MSALLEIDQVTKDFVVGPPFRRQTFQAVKGVSLSIEAGASYGLVGESGSGKTTVARMVAHLTTPTSGTIRFDGRDTTGLRGRELLAFRRDVQMIFQDPYGALNPRMSVLQLISEPWAVHRLHTVADRRRRAAALLDRVGLPSSALERKPVEFSGGQRQRIMIARALALEPRLIVADEPVSALDVSVQAQVLNLLKDLQDELGLTYLFISHNLSVVEFISDHIGVMLLGDLVEEGDRDAIYRSPRTEYTRRLLDAIPSLPDVRERQAEGSLARER
ncbi:ATP-binding cassette domain-containing protein [Leifsonia shinshuensis]|uniref:ATP-binding cassette domain-containing protein n=1 Tax=Leifsonia shinshuensis TaxID=150026 RepID=UPI00285993D3|nr:ATP-binding cassette domain-containing protein [Leifsonia shinshuensis]MDR6972875.1 ABC-type glutathione transport system ATPase component [Leifsonia shinshuensis]